MKLVLAATVAAVLAVGPAAVAQAKPQGRWIGPCSTWEYGENLTPGSFHADPARAIRMMRRLVVCVFDRWAPGQASHALYVADRESSFYPWAQNPSSLCSGLFQHVLSAWPGRARAYLYRGWFAPYVWRPVPPWSDPRANAIVAARMVASGGWGPWGG